MENLKSAQTIAPVDEFKGSPGRIKHTLPDKNDSNPTSFFLGNSMKQQDP
jgi:hypothetical protein